MTSAVVYTSQMRKNTAERLTSKAVRDAAGCLLWVGALDRGGYGVIRIGGRRGNTLKAHRVAWTEANGPIPAGLFVCHSCDVRNCIEPAHLWLGTQADNNRDMFAKGRHRAIGGWNGGRPHSAETRAKISAAAKSRTRRPHSAETRERMAEARRLWWANRELN